jgi:hypothetical protein
MDSLTERYDDRIAGVLSCYDRVMVTRTLPRVCFAAGMTQFLNANKIRIFDYPQFAAPLRDRVRESAEALAAQAGITIAFIGRSHVREEAVVAGVVEHRTKELGGPPSGLLGGHRLHGRRQCVRQHRRLGARASIGRSVFARGLASPARLLCRAVLSGDGYVPADLSLEPDAGRIRHRHCVPFGHHAQAAL